MSDLAKGEVLGTYTPELLFAGDAPVITGAAKADSGSAAISKGQVLYVQDDGEVTTVIPVNTGVTTLTNALRLVIAAQPGVAGGDIPFYRGGCFNYAAIAFGVLDDASNPCTTVAAANAFFGGTPISFGALPPQ